VNDFEQTIAPFAGEGLYSAGLQTMQVNLGLVCNQRCAHCHVSAGPDRTETMEWPVMRQILKAVRSSGCPLVDLTGGAPELNPHFRPFIKALRAEGCSVQVRTNLTVLLEPGMEDVPVFLREQRVRLVASLPCYTEQNVRAQRGATVYEKSIEVLEWLNALGYGREPGLDLNLIYNPLGPFLPSAQSDLEKDYHRELRTRFGVEFSRLLTITNMPIGRFLDVLRSDGREQEYLLLLKDSFNPDTVADLMCRHQLSVAWDGTLYDCDFNLALACPVDHGAPDCIAAFDPAALARRRIVTGEHCYGCTAGFGSSCGGALA